MMRFGTVFVCVMMLAGSASFGQSRKPSQKKAVTTTKGYRQKQQELKDLRQRRAELQRKLGQNKKQEKVTLAEIVKVDAQLDIAEAALHDTTVKLNESRVEQKKVGRQLDDATDELNRVREQVRQRLKRMHMAGPTSMLSVVLKSRTAGELASRTEQMGMVARSDRSIFVDYRAARARVADRKQAADQIVVRVADLASRQREWQGRLASAKDEKRDKVRRLQTERAQIEAMMRQLDSDMRQITSQIQAFLRAQRKKRGGRSLPPFVGRFLRPVNSAVTSGFGYRRHPILKTTRLHAGVDLRGNHGDPVKAAASGEVIAAQYMQGYGNTVIIDHGGEIATVYAHLSRIGVRSGQMVKQGQRIGAVGSTGLSTAPHLHWEVRKRGVPVNPMGRL